MTSPQGLTDEQVEILLNALLDFHSLLTGLSNRLQSKLAQVEQRIAEERASARPVLSPAPTLHLLNDVSNHNISPQEMPVPPSPDKEFVPENEWLPVSAESFTMIDFDDDES
jgi:hypothetical protein